MSAEVFPSINGHDDFPKECGPERPQLSQKIEALSKLNGGRVLRNRRYKRPFEDRRPVKRLFTPEIKRYLKGWLIRRRENPYPSREEKKQLAIQTGLTYIQICNWFANWRRKLKNAGKEVDKLTWTTLIKSYNDQAMGNVEQFSISSDDSIWEEPETETEQLEERQELEERVPQPMPSYPMDHCYTTLLQPLEPKNGAITEKEKSQELLNHQPTTLPKIEPLPQCFQISSTSDFVEESRKIFKPKKQAPVFKSGLKPNKRIISKYLGNMRKKSSRDRNGNYKRRVMDEIKTAGIQFCENAFGNGEVAGSPMLLSKWRKSAACFQPSGKSYLMLDCLELKKRVRKSDASSETLHGREELDAAEALTFLARASLNKA